MGGCRKFIENVYYGRTMRGCQSHFVPKPDSRLVPFLHTDCPPSLTPSLPTPTPSVMVFKACGSSSSHNPLLLLTSLVHKSCQTHFPRSCKHSLKGDVWACTAQNGRHVCLPHPPCAWPGSHLLMVTPTCGHLGHFWHLAVDQTVFLRDPMGSPTCVHLL